MNSEYLHSGDDAMNDDFIEGDDLNGLNFPSPPKGQTDDSSYLSSHSAPMISLFEKYKNKSINLTEDPNNFTSFCNSLSSESPLAGQFSEEVKNEASDFDSDEENSSHSKVVKGNRLYDFNVSKF